MKAFYAALTLLTCSSFTLSSARAEARAVWSVGSADRSGRELGIFGRYSEFRRAFPPEKVFTVGQDSSEAWPYIHPGPADGWAGGQRHTLRIAFDLDAPPKGTFTVVVDTVSAHAGLPPTLEVRANGAAEPFPLPAGPGEVALDDERRGQPYTVRAVFPPDAFHAGRNEVALTSTTGSWFLYDAVRLENDPDVAFQPLANPRLEPTALFARNGEALDQVVMLAAQAYYPGAKGTATLRWDGRESVQPVEIRPGDARIPLRLPEVTKPTPLRVTLDAGGQQAAMETVVKPQRKWTLYVDPTVHTDIGYTDRQAAVRKLHAATIASVLERMREDPSFHWNLEVMWHARIFLAEYPSLKPEFFQRIREGRIGLHAGFLNMLTGLMSDEEMNRYAYEAEALRRQTGVATPMATLTDVPSATWALPSALAASGVRYFALGANQGRSGSIASTGLTVPFTWEGPDGAKIMAWQNDAYGRADWLRSDATMDSIERAIARLVDSYSRPDYPFDAVYVYGALMDNAGFDRGFGSKVSEWNAAWAYPRIVMGRGDEFFRHIEQRNPGDIRTVRGDFGGWWEDGAGSSAAETAMNRAAQRRITQAETLWSMARLAGHPAKYPVARFDAAWDNIVLYDEHTWGASQSISEPESEQTRDQWAVKAGFAEKAARGTTALHAEGLAAVAGTTPARRGDVVVVNTLPWARSGLVTLPQPLPAGFRLMDAQGRATPVQRSGGVDFAWAEEVPGMGAKVYRIASGAKPANPPAPQAPAARANVLENRYYRIRLEPGKGIVSIVDRAAGRELVDASGRYGFGQVVYAAGGEDTGLTMNGTPAPRLVMNDGGDGLAAEKGTVLVTRARVTGVAMEEDGKLFSEAVIRSEAPSMPRIETRVRLYHNERRIELIVGMTKQEIRRKEAVYVAFPFRVNRPTVELAMTNATARPDRDFVPGACHEWYAVQDGVRLSDADGQRIAWSTPDAPLVTLGDINRGEWPRNPRPASGLVFSYAMNNYWFTNYKAGQGGDFTFRYSIGTGADADRTGAEAAAPLCAAISPGVSGSRPPRVSVSGAGVTLTTLKGAQDGQGYILRLRNTGSAPTTAKIALPGTGWRAERASLVERRIGGLPVRAGVFSLALKPRETATVRLVEHGTR